MGILTGTYHRLELARHLAYHHLPPFLGRHFKAKVKNKTNYYFLLEFPKCGRTWLRYMLNQAETKITDVPLINTLHGVDYADKDLPRVIYVHGFTEGLSIAEKHMILESHKGCQGIVFQVRQPERVMVSYFYQAKFRNDGRYQGDIHEFIRDPYYGIQFYVDYVEFYLNAIKDLRHHIVTYENLKENPRDEFSKILTFCNIDLNDDDIDAIVANSTFEKMQAFEERGKLNPSWIRPASSDPRAKKIRSGGGEDVKSQLNEEDLEYIRSVYKDSWAFKQLGYA